MENNIQIFENTELVKVENNQVVTDSRSVAEHFGKRHNDVTEVIRKLLATENSVTKMFYESEFEYRGQKFTMYLMNRDGFTLLVMGFTGKRALEWKLKYINAFNEMEQKLANKRTMIIPKDYPSALRALADEFEKSQKLLEENKKLAPKAEFYDTVANSESLLSMGHVAKALDMGIGRNKLFEFLRSNGILNSHNIPYQRFVNAGYFKLVESTYMAGDNQVVATTTYVKQKGVDYIRKLLLNNRK